MLGGKMIVQRNEGFEGKKRRVRPRVLNKAAKTVLKKARYKIEDSTRNRFMKSECQRPLRWQKTRSAQTAK